MVKCKYLPKRIVWIRRVRDLFPGNVRYRVGDRVIDINLALNYAFPLNEKLPLIIGYLRYLTKIFSMALFPVYYTNLFLSFKARVRENADKGFFKYEVDFCSNEYNDFRRSLYFSVKCGLKKFRVRYLNYDFDVEVMDEDAFICNSILNVLRIIEVVIKLQPCRVSEVYRDLVDKGFKFTYVNLARALNLLKYLDILVRNGRRYEVKSRELAFKVLRELDFRRRRIAESIVSKVLIRHLVFIKGFNLYYAQKEIKRKPTLNYAHLYGSPERWQPLVNELIRLGYIHETIGELYLMNYEDFINSFSNLIKLDSYFEAIAVLERC